MKLLNKGGASKNTSIIQNLDDAELVRMLENEETKNEAMKVLMSRHHKALSRICYHYLHNPVLVEDAEEDTWLLALEQIGQHLYIEQAQFSHWLHSIARNRSVRISGKEGFYNHDKDALKLVLFRSAASRRIPEWDDKFYTLPPWVQRILQKRVIEGRSTQQTVDELHVSVSAVKKACRIAVKLLGESEYETE